MTPVENAISLTLSLGGDGLSVVVKECLAIANLPTRCGSRALERSEPACEHAVVIKSLLASGCKIIGRANMHELAFGMTGMNEYLGTPTNPRWPNRIPGGSSSGSASAVAAELCDFAIGTDTGGSIRQPATCCGVFGLKPTFGRIDRTGAMPAESSLDCIGPLARSARMLTEAMKKIDPTFATCKLEHSPQLKRVVVDADAAILTAVEACLAQSSVSVSQAGSEIKTLSEAYDAAVTIINREMAVAVQKLTLDQMRIGNDVRFRLRAAEKTTDEAFARAENMRQIFTREIDDLLMDVDALVLPSLPHVPPTLADANYSRSLLHLTKFLRPFNLSGHPSLTIPYLTEEGLPAGIQLVGKKGDDALLCAIAQRMAAR